MRELVGERADLPVGGSGGDDDLAALGVAPAAGPVLGELADLDACSRARGVGDQRGDQVVVAVAGDRLCGRGERDGLACRAAGRSSQTSKTGTVRKKTFFSPVSSPCVVALLDGDGGEDPDRLLALAHAAVEVEEGAEAGDVGRRDPARRGTRSRSALVARL